MNTFVIADPKRCIGCRTCEVACVLAHSGDEGLQGMSAAHFIPRLKLIRTAKVSTPVQCHQCEDAPCVKVCSTGAIVFSSDSVQVNQERCVGCKSCMIACPYGAVEIVTVEKLERVGRGISEHTVRVKKVEAQKCDLCITQEEGPACIRVCLTKALRLVDQKVMSVAMKGRQENAAIEAGGMTI
jgi:electron transport protein HydN